MQPSPPAANVHRPSSIGWAAIQRSTLSRGFHLPTHHTTIVCAPAPGEPPLGTWRRERCSTGVRSASGIISAFSVDGGCATRLPATDCFLLYCRMSGFLPANCCLQFWPPSIPRTGRPGHTPSPKSRPVHLSLTTLHAPNPPANRRRSACAGMLRYYLAMHLTRAIASSSSQPLAHDGGNGQRALCSVVHRGLMADHHDVAASVRLLRGCPLSPFPRPNPLGTIWLAPPCPPSVCLTLQLHFMLGFSRVMTGK